MHRALPVLTSSFRATPQQITAPEIMPHGLGRAAVVVVAETEALPGRLSQQRPPLGPGAWTSHRHAITDHARWVRFARHKLSTVR